MGKVVSILPKLQAESLRKIAKRHRLPSVYNLRIEIDSGGYVYYDASNKRMTDGVGRHLMIEHLASILGDLITRENLDEQYAAFFEEIFEALSEYIGDQEDDD